MVQEQRWLQICLKNRARRKTGHFALFLNTAEGSNLIPSKGAAVLLWCQPVLSGSQGPKILRLWIGLWKKRSGVSYWSHVYWEYAVRGTKKLAVRVTGFFWLRAHQLIHRNCLAGPLMWATFHRQGSQPPLVCMECVALNLGSLQSNATAVAKSLQSYPTLWDSVDGSPPGSTVPGILQATALEWVAISFSNAWKWKVKVKCPALRDAMDCSPPGSSIHGIFQAKVLEWVAITFSVQSNEIKLNPTRTWPSPWYKNKMCESHLHTCGGVLNPVWGSHTRYCRNSC